MAESSDARAVTESPRSLRLNFSWAFAGNATYAAAKWVNVIALARMTSPEVLGRYALGLAVCAPVMMLADLQLRTVQATDARRDFRFGDYLRLRGVGVLAGLLVILAIASVLYRGTPSFEIVVAVALLKASESVADVFYGLFQQRERLDLVAQSLIAKGVIGTTTFVAVLHATGELLPSIAALVTVLVLVFASMDLRRGVALVAESESIAPEADARASLRVWPLAKLALPMGIAMALNSLYVNVPRYAIERHLGEMELGFFAALAYIVAMGSLFVSSLGQSVSPRLSRDFAERRLRAFRRLLLRVMAIVATLGVVGVAVASLLGETLLTHLYNESYAEKSGLFVWLVIVAALTLCGNVFGTAVTAMRRFRVQAVIHALGIVLITALSFPMVARFGLQGAAWAMLASTLIIVSIYAALAMRLFQEASVKPAS